MTNTLTGAAADGDLPDHDIRDDADECDDCHAPAGERHEYGCVYLLDDLTNEGDDADDGVQPSEVYCLIAAPDGRAGAVVTASIADDLTRLFRAGLVEAWRLPFPPEDSRHGTGRTVPVVLPPLQAGRRWFTVALTLPTSAPDDDADDPAWAAVAALALSGDLVVAGEFGDEPAACRHEAGRWLGGGRWLICLGCGADGT